MMPVWMTNPGQFLVRRGQGGAGDGRYFASWCASHRKHEFSGLHDAVILRGACLLGAKGHPWRDFGWGSGKSFGYAPGATRKRSAGRAVCRAGGTGQSNACHQRREPDRPAAQQPSVRHLVSRNWPEIGTALRGVWRTNLENRHSDPRTRYLLDFGFGIWSVQGDRGAQRRNVQSHCMVKTQLAGRHYRNGVRDAGHPDCGHTVRAVCSASRHPGRDIDRTRDAVSARKRDLDQSPAKSRDVADMSGRVRHGPQRPVFRCLGSMATVFAGPTLQNARANQTGSGLVAQRSRRVGTVSQLHSIRAHRQSAPDATLTKRIRGQ